MSVIEWDERLLTLSDDDETVVYVNRYNTAHALADDGQLVCGSERYGFPSWFFDQAPRVLLWWMTHDTRFKAWPAWPCQACMSRLADTTTYPSEPS